MTIAQLTFSGAVPSASVVHLWLKQVEDEPLWLVQAAFMRRVPEAEQHRIWKTAMGIYFQADRAISPGAYQSQD